MVGDYQRCCSILFDDAPSIHDPAKSLGQVSGLLAVGACSDAFRTSTLSGSDRSFRELDSRRFCVTGSALPLMGARLPRVAADRYARIPGNRVLIDKGRDFASRVLDASLKSRAEVAILSNSPRNLKSIIVLIHKTFVLYCSPSSLWH